MAPESLVGLGQGGGPRSLRPLGDYQREGQNAPGEKAYEDRWLPAAYH